MFTKSQAIYDAIYNTMKDYADEAQQIHTLIQQYKHSSGTSLLDIACGTGGHLPYLRHHYLVEGLDLDEQMLAIARQRNPGVIFHHADMVDFSLDQLKWMWCLMLLLRSSWRGECTSAYLADSISGQFTPVNIARENHDTIPV